jgi:hypothetical protein
MTIHETRNAFEHKAYNGYVSYGTSMTDGYYAPESRDSFVSLLRRQVPLTPDYFRYETEFHPTQAEVDEYNATFEVGYGWKPECLDLAVRWDKGWKAYEVTGTRHAYYLLRKLATRRGFQGARLQDFLVHDGYCTPNIISLSADDITGSDRFGKGRALLDRNNAHYDLQRDALRRAEEAKAMQDELDRRETQSDRDAWYDMDR